MKINKILIVLLINHIRVFLTLQKKKSVKMIPKIKILLFAKQLLRTIKEHIKKKKDCPKAMHMIHSVLIFLIRIILILLEWIHKRPSRIFHHFLYSQAFLIFLITDYIIIKTKLKEIMKKIIKATLVNLVNRNNAILILKIRNI